MQKLPDSLDACNQDANCICMVIPVSYLARRLTVRDLTRVAILHGVKIQRGSRSRAALENVLLSHSCDCCSARFTILEIVSLQPSCGTTSTETIDEFPPKPLSLEQEANFVRRWCDHMSPDRLLEVVCAVCGCLVAKADVHMVRRDECDLRLLERPGEGVTRLERLKRDDPVREHDGPILDPAGCVSIDGVDRLLQCQVCFKVLKRKLMPHIALANGRWFGTVPNCLKILLFGEQLLVRLCRPNACVAHLQGGQGYLKANAIIFEQPVAKVYDRLPPPRTDICECFTVIYTGPVKPTEEDYQRTPFIVRLPVVLAALEWLCLNHIDYHSVQIDRDRLAEYEDNTVPVHVIYRSGPETLDVSDADSACSAPEGYDCPFMVHSVSAENVAKMSSKQRLALSIKYFDRGGKALSVGHEANPESIYHNSRLYPTLFPWLYPYGLGGFENSRIRRRLDRVTHIRCNLMYGDRRFQTDGTFSYIAYNHEQIRRSSSGGYLLTNRKNFPSVVDKLLSIKAEALDRIVARTEIGGYVVPEDDDEKACLELMSIVDHVAGHVHGLNTLRKYQRNELRSLIYTKGMPVFFLTFAPADTKNPICLSLCGEDVDLTSSSPKLRCDVECMLAVGRNPVGAARFFHLMVNGLLEDVLRVGSSEGGLFGPIDGYYGTVEEQGRKTLHLHLLLWVKNCPSPQRVRGLLTSDPEFQSRFLAWMHNVHTGDFLNGTEESLSARYEEPQPDKVVRGKPKKQPPLLKIRDPATELVRRPRNNMSDDELRDWITAHKEDVDKVVFCSNRHDKDHKRGCLKGDPKYCKARFPRELFDDTQVDMNNGALRFRKREAWINTYNPVLSSILRCNMDVTSLHSGTTVRAVMAYVTDYVTKGTLSTHTFFRVVLGVLNKNSGMIEGAISNVDRREAARKLVIKMVNALSASTETGGPSASAYLLGFPDHYSSNDFKVFFWYTFVKRVMDVVQSEVNSVFPIDLDRGRGEPSDEVLGLERTAAGVLPKSKVDDYIYRPGCLGELCLYDFLARTDVKRRPKKRLKDVEVDDSCGSDSIDSELNDDEDRIVRGRGLSFTQEHPLINSHAVYLRRPSEFYTLNFAGGSLPRRDRGDYEIYCLTMLVFFKPGGWRDGHDVKPESVSASEVFRNTNFDSHHLRIMENMGVLYECLDSCDDFSAVRRRVVAQATLDANIPDNDDTEDAVEELTEEMLATVVDEGVLPLSDSTSKHLAMKGAMAEVLSRLHGELPPVNVVRVNDPNGSQIRVGEFPLRDAANWRGMVQ